MEPSIKETYRIQYVDNTYQLVEWTEDQLLRIETAMNVGRAVIMLDKCIYRLSHIRAIVYLPPVPEEENTEQSEESTMVVTEMGAYEKELYDLLVNNGYDPGIVLGEKEGN